MYFAGTAKRSRKADVRRPLTILLTAAIRPDVVSYTRFPDLAAREAEYMVAVRSAARARSHLTSVIGQEVPMVFAEGSGYASPSMASICAEEGLQYLDVAPPPSTRLATSKGEAEVALINRALEHPDFERDCDDELFVKVTGRYVLRNLYGLAKFVAEDGCDVTANLYNRRTYADSRIFGFNRKFFPYLRETALAISDARGYYLEHALADAVAAARRDGLSWSYLNDVPVVIGTSGTTGKRYPTNLAYLMKERVKLAFYRRLYR